MRPSKTPSAVYMQSCAFLHVPLLCVSLLFAPAMAQMPYNPTRMLQHGARLYVFQPSSSTPSQFELGTIDLSSTTTLTSKPPYTTLYPTLPFLDSSTQHAFTPILDNGGNMTVYTGDCAIGASGAEIWTFTPQTSDKSGNGTWQQQGLSFDKTGQHLSAIGSNYLNGGMAFSAVVDGVVMDTGAYFFGGMCPFQNDSSDWQSAANYSNLMVTLEPSQDGTKALNYQLSISTSRGPPIAEAGFTLTGLEPSFSNRSDGTQTQQQNFVLVGGHTSAAFINMSQVALFSLPQQGWTFVPVLQPDTQRTDLAIRADVDAIGPRSGHSAVLTPDGQRIVVFGGWIGDNDTPADPQLAVLNVGDGYGGQGDWEWTVPTTSGSGLPDGSGIYGHGAAMLPGGVMMIMGGYSISAPSSRWRRTDPSASTKTLFFNVTSNTWISEYSPPPDGASSNPPKSGPLATTSQKAGLGAGLGIGMATVLGLMVFYIWYTRRLKRQREVREKQLRDLAMGAHRYNLECLSPGVDGRGGQVDAVDYFDDANDSYFYSTAGSHHDQDRRGANGRDAERTGLLVEIPSPTRGLRRSLGGRASHVPRYDDRRIKGPGNIHPIDELEEEPEHDVANDKTPLTGRPEMAERSSSRGASIFESAPMLNPFIDGHRTSVVGSEQRNIIQSAPTSPIQGHEEPFHVPGDLQLAMTALLPPRSRPNSSGRVSPTKSERTGSTLSERSTRSNLSSHSTGGSVGRSSSMRSAAILNAAHANPFKTPDTSPTTDKTNREGSGWQSPVDPGRSFTSIRSNGWPNTVNADADSFTTARTSFMQLQAEGEALLGGNPERDRARPGTSSTSNGSNMHTYQDTEPTVSRAGTITTTTTARDRPGRRTGERRKSWLGSVRRALSRSTTTVHARTRSLTSTTHLESYRDNPASSTPPRPNRNSFPASAPPRRAASDASFWRSKRGKQDWLDEELDPNDPRARWRRTSGDDWGAPEDVALAEKERQRREWRERSMLINLGDDELPSPQTPIQSEDLGVAGNDRARPCTPADEDDWDVEAAVERRVVQVMFTVPKSKLRVVNADIERSSVLSLSRENLDDSKGESSSSPGRVKDIAGRFEQMNSHMTPPRASPRPSPSPSITSLRVRPKRSSASLAGPKHSPSGPKGKERVVKE